MPDETDELTSPEDRREPRDPNDEVPVPIAMEPAEIDERAQVVEALRKESGTAPRNIEPEARPEP